MSNRRKPGQRRRHEITDRRSTVPALPPELEGREPWLWAMQDADEAERRGDAAGALAAIHRRMIGPDGRVFWRPSRIRWLEQLVMLGSSAPSWVWSRWVLAQATQWFDHANHGPRGHAARAARIAIDLRGGLDRVEGVDVADRQAKVRDHDWVFRQVYLYEQEGLQRFLREGAAPDLVAGAGRVAEWAHAPMGAFRYLGVEDDSLAWWRVGTAYDVVVTPNIGTAVTLEPGDHALGRLVPVEGGVMFEGRVLAVPEDVAREVAAEPARWLDVLRAARAHVDSGAIDPHQGAWCALLSDVPISAVEMLLHDGLPDPEAAAATSPVDRALAAVDMATAIRARSVLLEVLRRSAETEDEHRELDDLEEGLEDHAIPAAIIHGALTDPAVVAALPQVVGPADRHVLDEVAALLAEPARSYVVAAVSALDHAA